MKELKKLAVILRALGVTAKVETGELILGEGGEIVDPNYFVVCDKGNVHFDVWFYDDSFELHFTQGGTLVYDGVCRNDLFDTLYEIMDKVSKFA